MKKAIFLMILIIISFVGCKQKEKNIDYESLSITEQIAALEMQTDLFSRLETTYDNYAEIHDWLYPKDKQIKADDVALSIGTLGDKEIKGEELIDLSLKEQTAYINKKQSGYVALISEINLIEKTDLSISDVYKDKSLDWYYVFTLKKIVLTEGESYIPSRYTLEKENENYKIIEYNSDMRLGIVDEKTKDDYLKKSGCSTFYGEPVTYIKTISY